MPASAALPRPPLPEDNLQWLSHLTNGLADADLWWLSGYAAGLAQRRTLASDDVPVQETANGSANAARLTIVYGSQTGNAQRVAEQLAQQAHELNVRLLRADAYPLRELPQERLLYVVISTQGDGDPPDDARAFLDFIASRRAPQLVQLQFAVLGLGDSTYPQFCAVARQLDERLAELGATRLLARGDADLDVETIAAPWSQRALEAAREALKPGDAPATITPLRRPPQSASGRGMRAMAEIMLNQRITACGSDKDVRHLELALEGIEYEPGDALLAISRNPPQLVDEVLAVLSANGDELVAHADEELPLRTWFGEKLELTRLSRPFVAAHAQRARDGGLHRLLESANAGEFCDWLRARQLIDLLQGAPGAWNTRELVGALRPLTPRAYSIASSRKAVGQEAHLTVARVEYRRSGAIRWGAASQHLGTRAEGEHVEVCLQRNERFRLPHDSARDIVMIGPGTGVAPYRGFVQERAATGARGRNWLLFGNPHFRSDFLYQTEWQTALKSGTLHRLDLAFSRDQAEKIYVQQRVRERSRELYGWLERGAHLYVCGATAMARDVEAALRDVIIEHGARTPEAANEYLSTLRDAHRYARDVY